MRIRKRWLRTGFILFILMTAVLSFLSAGDFVLTAAETAQVDIVIRNYTFEFQGGALRPNQPGTIVLKNLDKVQHGFTSPYLREQDVQVETAGGTAYGLGISGVYINPGETLRIHFTPNRPGSFQFRCDLHPNMKGELVLLSVQGVKD
ncbi:MAG TPA: cupredoxin domain-containing protein [Nitrospiria bacterium]|nr:cupredoxin domain-containing protein [Nitrospiria bacterium]